MRPLATLVLATLLAQLAAPALAPAATPADTSGTPAGNSVSTPIVDPTPVAPRPSTEDRHWAELVRACSASAKHVRLETRDHVYEFEDFEPESSGVRFGRPHASWSLSRGLADPEAGSFLAWNEITKVEVRNVSTASEGAATGGLLGLAVGTPIALAVALATAMGSVFTLRSEHDHSGGVLLAVIAAGALLGAASGHHPNGGWVTCCERDTSAAAVPAAILTH